MSSRTQETSTLRPLFRRIHLAGGFVCVGLGVLGIPLPLLPTTPFLLLAAYCFARSSQRWHAWLMTHRVLSPYILAFRDKRGLTRGQKWRIAGAVTVTLFVTGAFSPYWQGRGLALFIWSTSLLFLYFSKSAPSRSVAEQPEPASLELKPDAAYNSAVEASSSKMAGCHDEELPIGAGVDRHDEGAKGLVGKGLA
jgi:uncharacterized membrane protein YbaN (DUF454 family)